ncbi:hypothetical protein OAI07_00090 [Akkermansiaceae bacterium]|nr:hypothetical protein [Akkermansiaceae bacterium]
MTLAELNVPLIIALVIAAFIVIKFIKGLVRIVITLIALCIVAYLAWLGYGFLQGPSPEEAEAISSLIS